MPTAWHLDSHTTRRSHDSLRMCVCIGRLSATIAPSPSPSPTRPGGKFVCLFPKRGG